jgi:hypothetical protein
MQTLHPILFFGTFDVSLPHEHRRAARTAMSKEPMLLTPRPNAHKESTLLPIFVAIILKPEMMGISQFLI